MGALKLHRGEVLELVIRGACMPSLLNGATVRVKRRPSYLPGDVVVVRRNDYWDAHRFLGYAPSVHGLVALTQADSASHADVASAAAAILGRVECRVTLVDRRKALARYVKATVERVFGGRR